MLSLFLGAFVLGVIVGILVMLHGVERGSGALPVKVAPGARYPASLARPALGGFLTGFGLTGYLLGRNGTVGPALQLLVAAVVGVLGAWAAVAVVTRWAIPSALADEVDERYLLQGHVAQVTAAIGDTPGSVTWEIDGARHAAAARSLEGGTIPAGTEVVIERIEDGIAWVEPWATVEERI